MNFEPGQVLGEYKVVRPLGRGGLGAVYEAVHLISLRPEALKIMLPEQTGTDEMTERFRREVQLLASLNHPNIARLHNAFYHAEQLVMVMELVEGEDLRTRSRRERMAMSTLLDYGAQALAALEYAHARGVIHRDIKPANLMVTPSGQVKVLDFGIALSKGATDLTLAGSIIGSPMHMSPEQIRGEKATAQSDIYSLGVTLYELIAGQPPLRGSNTYQIMMAHLNQLPVPLKQVRADIPANLSGIISKALEKDPAHRFASAAEFLAALRTQDEADIAKTMTIAQVSSWQRVATDELDKPSSATIAMPLEPLIKHLASFIGPIAKVVVNRLAAKCTDIDQLYLEASRQIDDEGERRKFMRTRPNTLGQSQTLKKLSI